jgi:hypothetical protein
MRLLDDPTAMAALDELAGYGVLEYTLQLRRRGRRFPGRGTTRDLDLRPGPALRQKPRFEVCDLEGASERAKKVFGSLRPYLLRLLAYEPGNLVEQLPCEREETKPEAPAPANSRPLSPTAAAIERWRERQLEALTDPQTPEEEKRVIRLCLGLNRDAAAGGLA